MDDQIYNGEFTTELSCSCQFVQNETTWDIVIDKKTIHQLTHTPVIPGTTTGTIYHGNDGIQTFVINSDRKFTFANIGKPEVKVVSGSIKECIGEITFEWNNAPEECHLVVSYEYESSLDTQPLAFSKYKPKIDFVQPTFENFFSNDELEDIAKSAGTIAGWDFMTALGDTIKEKYESLYVKVHELTVILLRKGAVGYFWICCSPEIASIFETCTAGFYPCSNEEYMQSKAKMMQQFNIEGNYKELGVAPLGIPELSYRGSINNRWRLYVNSQMPSNMALVGCNDKREENSHYGRMTIHNFIV